MAKMRIDYKILKKLKKEFGDFEVGAEYDGKLYFRFGYWNHIDKDLFKSMFPAYLSIEQFLVDDDSDCGPLYIYYVWDDRFRAMDKQEFKREQKYKMVGWSLIGLAICIIYILLDKYIF
tara:strand:+ start:357 stop:713 length:357 start_codon:yes stop_codon:yes gene_type:complete